MLGDLIAVHVGPVARGAILEDVGAVGLESNLGVIARDFAASKAQIVGLAAADFKRRFHHRHDTPAERVSHFEASVRHGGKV
jgi:hypothetical protein